ncbi:hypothetical protein J1N35_005766 [Gossypium stocksii]|uniref:Uncharacterized protein n=1 Tax=Gossypium stocksii TaxID=47602 RepID=A0A9D3WEF5_9ROSI|nr:hypothetical protein J1N35_005766 [Gossypium stocksii]
MQSEEPYQSLTCRESSSKEGCLRERGHKWCMAVVSSCHKTASDKPEEGEDDVKSSYPLCPGRHTCYNGRDKRSRSREGELTPKTHPQFGLQAATRLHEARIASNRRSAIRQ